MLHAEIRRGAAHPEAVVASRQGRDAEFLSELVVDMRSAGILRLCRSCGVDRQS